jgi:ankyrin repeat protein
VHARDKKSNGQQPGPSRQIEQSTNVSGELQEPKFNKEQKSWQICVPRNSDCLFLAVMLSYLIPVENNRDDFRDRFERLFGHTINMDKMRDLIQSYNPFLDAEAYYDKIPRDLLQQFRNRVGVSSPNAWGSNNEVEGISRVLKCKIRLFYGTGSNDYNDISVRYRKDKVPELELFYDIAAARGSRDGNYYSFNLEKDVGDGYRQLFKVDKLLKAFVEKFIKHFEKKLTDYSDEIGLEGKTKNIGKIAKKIKTGAAIFRSVPYVGRQVSTLISLPATYMGKKYHRNKAKKIYSAVGKNRISGKDLRKVLVGAASDIFQKFESQFLKVTTDEGVERAVIKLAEDAVGRIMNYIKINADRVDGGIVEISSSFITEGVILGDSKEGMRATFTLKVLQDSGIPKMPKSGRTVKDENSSEEWKTSELYEKTGVVKVEDNITKYYEKKDSNTEKYGYRLPFVWELERWEELKREYNVSKIPPREEYKYVLKSEEIKEKLKNILDEINEKDPILQLGRIEKKVERENEGIDELKVGQGTILDKIEALPAKIAGASNQQIKDRGPVWFNMRESVRSFTGRVGVLEDLRKKLQNEDERAAISQAVAVTGLGGMGKTELARRYAKEHIKDYDGNVIWMDSETQESLRGSFKELAKNLNISTTEEVGRNIQERSVKSIVKDVYDRFGNVKSLFIFDNAEEYENIKEFLPHSLHPDNNKPYILITSRNRKWEVGEEGKIEAIPLGEFDPEEAEQFVKGFLEIKEDSQKESIKALTKELQYFPLALRQAVVYIKRENEKSSKRGGERFKISDYLKKYQEQVDELLGEGCYENSDRYTKTVLTTWVTTLKKIAENQKYGGQAIDILNIMAYFAPDKLILKELFSMPGTDERWDAVELLDQYSMIDLKNGVSDIHRLVQQVARLRLKNGNKDEGVLKEALKLTNSGNISEKSIGHVISVWSYASKYNKLIDDFYFNPNSIYGYNCATPLHLLAESGNHEAVRTILERIEVEHPNKFHEVINAKDKYNRVPLYMAAENGHVGVVKLLVDRGAKIDTKSSIAYDSLSTKKASGWTSLHIAAFNGYLDIVKILVGKDETLVNINDSTGRTPAVLAASSGQVDIVEFLKPGDNVYLLHAKFCAARKSGNLEDLKNFLEGLEEETQLKDIVDLKLGEWAPLHLAGFANWLEIAEILIRNGAKVRDTENSFTPLHSASSNGHLDVVELLIENGADPKDINKDGWTSLHAAAQNGRLRVIKYFIDDLKNEKSINVNITDKKGDTPLHTAAFHGKLDAVKFLLEREANINAVDILGATPLFSAALDNNREVFEFLLNKGAKVIDTTDNKTLIGRLNFSVLHIAAAYNDKKIIEDLIDKGVDKDIGGNVSLTPLHLAAFFGSSEAVKCLIERGADTKACVKLSEVIKALKDTEKDNALRVSSMHGVVKRLISFSSYFTSHIKLTPGLICEIFNCSDKDLFGERQIGPLSKIVKWIFNLGLVRKQVDNLKIYVEQRKNPCLNHPIDAAFFTGEGVGVNARDGDGNTALHLAVKEGNVELVEYLILINEKKANPNVQDNNKKTPLDLAQEKLAQDQENDDLKKIVDILNQQIQSPGTSQSGNQLPETTDGTNDNPETCLSGVIVDNQLKRSQAF